MNPEKEITGNRPSNYSQWHRTLPKWCMMTDGDWFEQRWINGKITSVAYIETIQIGSVENANVEYPVWEHKERLCREIEEKMGIPVFVVWHTPDCKDFMVLRITETEPKRMDENEYIAFVKQL